MRTKWQIRFLAACIALIIAPSAFCAEFKVVRVYDGDSFRAVGHDVEISVRLAGIDAPEGVKRGRKKSQPFSGESTAFLSKLILNKIVDVKGFGTDHYNRVLAVVYIDELNVNTEMLRAGLAEAYRGRVPRSLDMADFQAIEEEAKVREQGMWTLGHDYVSPSTWRKIKQK